jgi:hypothetical protein
LGGKLFFKEAQLVAGRGLKRTHQADTESNAF